MAQIYMYSRTGRHNNKDERRSVRWQYKRMLHSQTSHASPTKLRKTRSPLNAGMSATDCR